MRLKLDIEIPQWTKWLAAGIAIGAVLGVGASRVYADTVAVKTWAAGDSLNAADLNANFASLQAAINQLQHPDCPIDYTRDTTVTNIVLCKKGVDEVVKVGTGGSAFWVDRYEATIWQNADGSGTQYGLSSATEFPATFPANGQYAVALYALSVAGKQPTAYVTWFQAQMACRASGKRLPTGDEWLAAAMGTQDPGAHDATGGFCVTSGSGPRNTGAGTACVCSWGAQDMIGNLWEWTTDWQVAPGNANTPNLWPDSKYNGDGVWNVISSALDPSAWQVGLPAAAIRGGMWGDATRAGVFSMAVVDSVSNLHSYLGFRCVIPR